MNEQQQALIENEARLEREWYNSRIRTLEDEVDAFDSQHQSDKAYIVHLAELVRQLSEVRELQHATILQLRTELAETKQAALLSSLPFDARQVW